MTGFSQIGKSDLDADTGRLSDAQIIELLASEIRDTSTRASTFILAGERILATVAAIFALVGAFAVSGSRTYIFMGLPLAIGIVVTYTLFLNNEAMALGGYRQALEEEFTRRAGVPIFQWESTIARNNHNRVQVLAVLALLGVAFTASCVVALVQAFATQTPGTWGHEFSALYIAATIASILLDIGTMAACFLAQERNRFKFHMLVASEFSTLPTMSKRPTSSSAE